MYSRNLYFCLIYFAVLPLHNEIYFTEGGETKFDYLEKKKPIFESEFVQLHWKGAVGTLEISFEKCSQQNPSFNHPQFHVDSGVKYEAVTLQLGVVEILVSALKTSVWKEKETILRRV